MDEKGSAARRKSSFPEIAPINLPDKLFSSRSLSPPAMPARSGRKEGRKEMEGKGRKEPRKGEGGGRGGGRRWASILRNRPTDDGRKHKR